MKYQKTRKGKEVIEAIQFNGVNHEEIKRFTNGQAYRVGNGYGFSNSVAVAVNGDWIIKAEDGAITTKEPGFFELTYKQIES